MEHEGSDHEDIQSVKIVFLGDKAVGKTSIIRRFISDNFDERQHATVGIDYMFKTLLFRGSRYKLELWDTAGQEKYRSLVKSYLKNADCCIYVHDVNDLTTYHHIIDWMNIFEESNPNEVLQLIAGNKIDLKEGGFSKEASHFGLLYNKESRRLSKYTHVEVSAKEKTNIVELLETVLAKLLEMKQLKEKRANEKMVIRKLEVKEKRYCCSYL